MTRTNRQSPVYLRAYRIRSRKQKTLPIPVGVLAKAIANEDAAKAFMSSPISDHLGDDIVAAVKEAGETDD
ncbi:hypothetical protein [Amycolatopsis thermoflava]|uniref:hypothetical protein n=1 Tax=Amycolatopsis thermoflava TaxID=84480 RepID=UPI00040EA595|nr:hypothetical protein [Amycolatopsis thermoflava]